eukprot:CAMPEP_0198590774 /NCGR_PEP_ID=MMETSP1462-20131121/136051_1 /TAXON_ID=1333877 /ORGANISM="Brandtodinium nutriculum, Strain RCC3387" /LENGTH=116 /DNA_ID=CAMNT_0044322317 /DNA_START=156 /DNA_END=502 /DNA_ORIENTATION=+
MACNFSTGVACLSAMASGSRAAALPRFRVAALPLAAAWVSGGLTCGTSPVSPLVRPGGGAGAPPHWRRGTLEQARGSPTTDLMQIRVADEGQVPRALPGRRGPPKRQASGRVVTSA